MASVSIHAAQSIGRQSQLVLTQASIAPYRGIAHEIARTNKVRPVTSGSPTANFYIIGEALGADEERIGRPFVGASGKELYSMLEEARWLPPGTARTINDALWRNNLLPLDKALEANDIFICNVTSDRPPSNDINKFFVTKTTAKRSGISELNGRFPLQPIVDGLCDLTAYLEQYRPNFILCLGGTALWAFTGFTGITKWRGSILPVEQGPVGSIVGRSGQPTKLIPTFHPADILREWPHRAIAVQDMRRAYRERQFPEIRRPTYHFITRPSYPECMDWLRHHTDEPSLRDVPLVGDIETPHGWRNLPGHIACIGFADSRTSAICIPLMCVDNLEGYWTPEQEVEVILALRRLMTTRPMIWHKGDFDIMHIIRHWGFQPNWTHDNMVAQHVAFPGLLGGKIDPVTLKVSKKGSSLSLLFCSSMYCDYHRAWKDDGKDWNQKEVPDEDGWWRYNCEDCVRTYESFEALMAILHKFSLWEAYTFMMSLGQPVMDMMLHGLPVDIARRDEFTKTVRSEQKMLQKWIDVVCGHPLNTGSTGPTGQMQKLFYEDMAIPIVYKGRGKERRPSLDKTALDTISKKIPLLAPLCDTITAERSLAHFDEGILSDNLDEDCYMRTTVNLTGTETMRFSSTETVYGRGINCLLPTAEVLTEFGWKELQNLLDGETIAQWEINGELRYVEAKLVKQHYIGPILKCKTEQYNSESTPNHRIPYRHYYHNLVKDRTAKVFSENPSIVLVPVSGVLYNGEYQPDNPRALVAALADGTYEDNRVRWSFKKRRKTNRLRSILTDFWENKPQTDYDSRIVCYRPENWPREKKWGSWVLYLSQDWREIILDELQYWDGWKRNRSTVFCTADSIQAEWVSTLAHISGRSSTIKKTLQSEGSWSDTTMYLVNIKPRDYVNVERKHWSISHQNYDGFVYCVQVPSSYFLVRQNHFISVTGNSQNINRMPEKELDDDEDNEKIHLIGDPPPVRRLFRPSSPQMLLFEVDLERADPQVCAKESDDGDLLTAFREKHDIYSEMGRWAYELEYISKEQRQYNKNAINGVDYGCKARTLATTIHTSIARAEQYLDRWFTLHPGIKQWHERIDNQLYKTRTVRNVWGFRRYYTDRLDSLLPQALAWICSSTVSITINKAMRRIYDELPEVRLFLQIHDSILGEVPLSRAEYLLPRIVECCRIEIPYKPEPLVIPGSLKTSLVSWGDVEPWSVCSNHVWRTVVNEQLEKFGIGAIAKGDAPPWEG